MQDWDQLLPIQDRPPIDSSLVEYFGQVLGLLFLDGPCDRIVLLNGERLVQDVLGRREDVVRHFLQVFALLGRDYCRSLRIPAVMADAFVFSASIAAMACSWASLEPPAFAHRATSSIAAANAYWLCSRRVSTSAVAI